MRLITSLFLLAALIACTPKSELPIVAITQIVSHASLDQVHKGVVDELAEQGFKDGKTIQILFQNPQGNFATASQIAKLFVSKSPKAIVAISTPSAQTAMKAAAHTAIPVIFATVTDPVLANLVSDLKHPGGNVTGTRNAPPVEKELELIRMTIPSAKNIGMLVNMGEPNSTTIIENTKAAAVKFGFTIVVQAVQGSAEVPMAAQNLARRVDAVMLIQDNTVASALPSVIKVMNAAKVPVFATFADAMPAGALAGIAFDEYTIGRQTGKMVARVLRGEKPGDIAVEDPNKMEILVNDAAAKELGIRVDKPGLQKSLGTSP